VAGFSCVDFSSLNNVKRDLDAGGESGDTFKGVFHYAKKFHPTIIILENVNGAPWGQIQDLWPQIGYTATFMRVDTKDYYIPHTRQRGYMLCINNASYLNPVGGELQAKSVVSNWKTLMKKFERRASCSVEAFLLDEGDPRLIRGKEELSLKGGRAPHSTGWANCHGRHQDYRAALLLGQKRPITKWEDGGSCKATDQMWQSWILRQVERVWDAVDICYLRNLLRGFDLQYKL
jgi:site-specific DNA-cytosine methylase